MRPYFVIDSRGETIYGRKLFKGGPVGGKPPGGNLLGGHLRGENLLEIFNNLILHISDHLK